MNGSSTSASSMQPDLIVVGSGGGGLTAALSAARRGLSVLVVEKTELVGGTTAISGGSVWVPANHRMHEVGVPDSAADALAYMQACVGPEADESHLIALAEHSAPAVLELERAGVMLRPFPTVGGGIDYRPWLPGYRHGGRGMSSPRVELSELGSWASRLRLTHTSGWDFDPLDYFAKRMHLDPPGTWRPSAEQRDGRLVAVGRGAALVAQLLAACLRQGVQVRTNARADRLVLDGDRVAGVVVNGAALDAATGVVLATGGYSPDVQLRSLWLGRMIDFSCELESNSGDGHRMGLAAGADLGGMGDAWWMPHIPVGVENAVVNSAGSREDRMLPHTMMVDATGRRFMNEALNYHDAGETFPVRGGAIQHYPAWLLFDQEGVERYAILTWKVEGSRQAGADWYHSAATVAELAPQLGIEPAVLTRSVERFNGFARSGVDEDFRRGENPWDLAWGDPACTPNPCLAPLDRGPFHAVRVHPGALSTRGGLRVDDRGRVLGVTDGQPIAGLFAVGNCSNAGPAGAYPGPGATLGAALTFGYLAGQAAAETHASLRP